MKKIVDSKSRIKNIWYMMKKRCYKEDNPAYKWYGGRGITICQEWLDDFMNFYNWAMENGYDENLTIDRIDCNGNYEPNNCRWATQKEQQNNRRTNHFVEYNGEKHTISEWAAITGISRRNIFNRLIILGWSVEDTLGKNPVKTHKIKKELYEEWQRVYKRFYHKKKKGEISETQFRDLIEKEVKKYAV